jgi:hypothetical protein
VRSGPTYGTGVGTDGTKAQAQSRENAGVGVMHVGIFTLEIRIAVMERVTVLHDELAPAHYAKSWADFIAKFCLDLVEVSR